MDPSVVAARHRVTSSLLALHAPVLVALGFARGVDPQRTLVASLILPLGTAALAQVAKERTVRSLLVTLGLVWCSGVLVDLTGSAPVAVVHVLAVFAAVALYQDPVPLAAAVVGAAAVTGIGATHGHVGQPWVWAAAVGGVLAGSTATQVVLWQAAARDRGRAADLAADLATTAEQSDRRRSMGDLLVSLARRNQSLLERQLELIDDLERDEADAGALSDLFRLDHFATRMRRNAESLLVLAGQEPTRRRSDPAPMSEVVRGAVGEIEDYTRVDIITAEDPTVSGRAVRDLAHLLAELVENAATFSPPDTRVVVAGQEIGTTYVLRVKDRGVGMTEQGLHERNGQLAAPPDADLDLSTMLGLHVVGRLAQRMGVQVTLERNAHGGVTAAVVIPGALLVMESPNRTRPLAAALAAIGPDPDEHLLRPSPASVGAMATMAPPPPPRALPDHATRTGDAGHDDRFADGIGRGQRPAGVGHGDGAGVAPLSMVDLDAVFPVPPPIPSAVQDAAPGGLARRVPQASLAPGLAGGPADDVTAQGDALGRSETVRSRLSRFQSGLDEGRGRRAVGAQP